MSIKIYRYEVTFCLLVKSGSRYCAGGVSETVTIEDAHKLSPITIHNRVRKNYVTDYGEDPGYLVITEIKVSVVTKEYQEVK